MAVNRVAIPPVPVNPPDKVIPSLPVTLSVLVTPVMKHKKQQHH